MSKAETKSPTVDVGTLSKLFNVTDVWIQRLSKEGVIVKATHGKYELWPSIKGFIKHLQDRKTNQWDGTENEGYEEHRARLTKAKADIAEIEADLRKAQVHDAGAVAAVWGDMLMNAKAKLLAMPTVLAGRVHGEESLEAIRNLIEESVTQALNELSEYDPSLATDRYVSSHSETVEAASEMDDEPVVGQPAKAVKRVQRRARAVANKPG